MYKLLKRI